MWEKYGFFLFRWVFASGVVLYGGLPLVAQNILLKGQVLDAESRQPLPFVHIQESLQSRGTFTDAQGFFQIEVSNGPSSQIHFSHVGYQSQTLRPADWPPPGQAILLQSEAFSTPLIEVSHKAWPDPQKLVQKAIQKIGKNFPRQPFFIEGYYREWLEDSVQKPHYLTEATLGLYDPGFAHLEEDIQVKIYQKRWAEGYPIHFGEHYENNIGGRSGHLSLVGSHPMAVLLFNNPVRNYLRSASIETGYELNPSFLLQHSVEIDRSITWQGQSVYVVRVQANTHHPYLQILQQESRAAWFWAEGELYIRAEDAAIVRMHYTLWQENKTKKSIFNHLEVVYQDREGQLFPAYLRFENDMQFRKNWNTTRFQHIRELRALHVHHQQLPPPETYYLFEAMEQQFDQQYLKSPAFWQNLPSFQR